MVSKLSKYSKKRNKFLPLLLLCVVGVIVCAVAGYASQPFYSGGLAAVSKAQPKATGSKDYNLGEMPVRVIVVNLSDPIYGDKFTQTKLAEAEQAMKRLDSFVQKSSYGKAKLNWKVSGPYTLKKGICTRTNYGEKVDTLILRALQAADTEIPLADYSHYIIVRPQPNCQDGENWTFEGKGDFTTYKINGKKINLRGIHIGDLSDMYLFHEFGHSLGYKPNLSIGHPSFFSCPVSAVKNGEIKISVTNSCATLFDAYNGIVPTHTIMASLESLSDYSAIEKEKIGWLQPEAVVVPKAGDYVLDSYEKNNTGLKVLKIPVATSNMTFYISYRQPAQKSSTSVPDGVIVETTGPLGVSGDLLVVDRKDKKAPLMVGVTYQLGVGGPKIKVQKILNDQAFVSVSFGK